ncbi:MAG: DUF3179 domain-containing protein [Calditrichia bacterium]|nr:DUF3179 domain-containing protein [Calditrichia bacterium]
MYDRQYEDKIFTFEPSGGLINASLVMQDFETNTYWSIMTNEAIHGEKKGTKLRELPVSVKVQWEEWVEKYPNTLVLSVDDLEDASSGYVGYFNSPRGFRGIQASDQRLSSKEPIFAFEYQNKKYAVTNETIESGKVFDLGIIRIFLYRPEGADIYYSTLAFQTNGSGFSKLENRWIENDSECVFDTQTGTFTKGVTNCPERLNGFDTFWYTWSLNNPDTELLDE